MPVVPSAESHAIQSMLRSLPSSTGMSVDEWRAAAGGDPTASWPEGLRATPVDAGGVPCEWAWFGAAGDDPVVLQLHGGGFVLCGIDTHREQGARVAAACGGRALVVGYRLAPEHPFPAAIDDCVTAYRWLLDQGTDPSRIVVLGDSAGGTLALSLSLRLRDLGIDQPAALVLASPLTDLTAGSASHRTNRDTDPFSRLDDIGRFADLYLQGADQRDPLASPRFADLAGLPPMLVLVGPGETLLDDSIDLAERATTAGIDAELDIVDGAFHTWLGHAGRLPEADASIARIGAWVDARLR
ncbi:MAG: Alpha/beta hydrolase fold-3 domain protein [Actinomycetia bacterium]|nr:Alpha/beta hydrolase fold-3 domain protein [Actinomycetes bacterium]